MRIERNYKQSFFKERKKPNHLRTLLLLLTVVVLVGSGFILTRPEAAQQVVTDFMAPPVSPTPMPEQLAVQAQQLFANGQLDLASAVWEEIVTMRPTTVSYLYEHGMLLIDLSDGRNDNAERAEIIADDIIAIDPNDPRGYALRARALVWNGNPSTAITVALAGLDIQPDFSPLYEALARAYIGTGRLREGQEAGLQAIDYGPTDVRAYWAYATTLWQSGARDAAIDEYQRTLEVNPNFLPPYFELAFLYLASNRDQEAIDTYNRILGVQPRNARALLRSCEAYRKIGQFERAFGLCQDAVAADPTYAEAQYRLGLILYADRNDFEGAKNAFEACLNYEPDNLRCSYRLGLTYYYLARTYYRDNCEAQRLSPLACDSVEICEQGWDLLESALTRAQSLENAEGDIEIIRTGLGAITADSACAGVAGIAFPTATPQAPETTEEPEQP